MALLNPVYGLIVPFLFVVTIPLAIFAGITTTLAFSVLMFRVAVVYVDLALNMVPQYLIGRRVYPLPRGYNTLTTLSSPLSSGQLSPSSIYSNRALAGRSRRRRTSIASVSSVGSVTPIDDNGVGTKRNSFLMCGLSSSRIDRDYEGVGGWRLDDRNDDDWALINSRLELPLERGTPRHHHRSPSGGGATTPGGEGSWLMMKSADKGRGRERKEKEKEKVAVSPNSSRLRTPTRKDPTLVIPQGFTTMDGADGYFPPVVSPTSSKRQVAWSE